MIAIVDYGMGNLRSVENALHFIGCEALITSDIEVINKSQALILPGVGAFARAMHNLKKTGLDNVVIDAIKRKKLFMGICLGLQILFDYSEEGGERVEGLGVFSGAIKHIPAGKNIKVPHIGWNSLELKNNSDIFNGLNNVPYVYFVHSYFLDAIDKKMVIATSTHGIEMDVAIENENTYAFQFHPEKSGDIGLSVLRNFAKRTNESNKIVGNF